MSVRRGALTAAALTAAVAAAIALPAAGGASADGKRATKTVTVGDNFFAPDEVKIKKNDKVKWVWSASNTQTHDVYLTSGRPKGVKASDFRSGSASANYAFKRKFEVLGSYDFVCTYHRSVMRLSVKVTK